MNVPDQVYENPAYGLSFLGSLVMMYLYYRMSKLERENQKLRTLLFKSVIALRDVADPKKDSVNTIKIADSIILELEKLNS